MKKRMHYLLLVTFYLLLTSELMWASNLRIDGRTVINPTLLRNTRTKNSVYPVRFCNVTDSSFAKMLQKEDGIIGYKDSTKRVDFHTAIGGRTGLENDSVYLFSTYYDFRFNGKFHSLEFDLSARNNLDYYNDAIVPRWVRENYSSAYYNTDTKDSVAYSDTKLWDENRFNVVFPFTDGSVEAGHGHISIGPSMFDNLFIGDSANGFDYYMADYTFGNFTFTAGMLGLISDADQLEKKMAFHRLNYNNSFLAIGIYEGVMFTGRDPLMYYIPVVPFIFSEHYYGDLDNNNMGIDATFFYKNAKLYGNIFIDDMYSLSSFFDDTWWGNKWAASVGGSYQIDMEKSSYIIFASEYTRVMPWVYTHDADSGLIRYTHYGKELGTAIGSDADRINALVEVGKIGLYSITTQITHTRKGPVSTFRIHDYDIDGDGRTFLESTSYKSMNYSSEIKAAFSPWRVVMYPKMKIGGDDDNFINFYQLGLDIVF